MGRGGLTGVGFAFVAAVRVGDVGHGGGGESQEGDVGLHVDGGAREDLSRERVNECSCCCGCWRLGNLEADGIRKEDSQGLIIYMVTFGLDLVS